MSRSRYICRIATRVTLVALLSMSLGGCVETVPEELVESIESLDRDLSTLRASDVNPAAFQVFPPMDCATRPNPDPRRTLSDGHGKTMSWKPIWKPFKSRARSS